MRFLLPDGSTPNMTRPQETSLYRLARQYDKPEVVDVSPLGYGSNALVMEVESPVAGVFCFAVMPDGSAHTSFGEL
jgi:hypothetical protein